MIYVEYHDGPEQTDAGRIDWQPGWYAICDDCGWMAGPCATEADAGAAADAHALARRQAGERPVAPGERCTCGRQAAVVYLASMVGPTGYCGIPDGGDRAESCPFCGGPRHRQGRCPAYRLRLDQH